MKVFELLTVPALTGMTIVAGESGKNREVHTVNMMDAPDIIPFLNPYELLITTAYHLKDQPHLLTELVQAMAEKGCAALGIKTKRYLNEVPKEAITLANELSFPIIELPLELSLGEIVNHSLRAILDKRATELTLALETHKQFTSLIRQGKGIQKLLEDLSDMIDRPIQLIDQHLKSIAPPYFSPEFFALKNNPSIDEFNIPSSKVPYISFSVLSNKQTYSLFPIYISEKKSGYLMIMGDVEKSDRLTTLTIEQATNVISFALMKEHALKQHERSIRNDFFLHFLDGSFSSQEEIMNRAKEFSLKNELAYICVVGKVDENALSPTYTQHQQRIDAIYEFIEDEVASATSNVHFFTKGELCVLLYEATEHTTSPGLYTESSLRQIQTKISSYFEKTISFGVSNISPNFLNIKNSFKEAMDALQQGQFSKKIEYIQAYHTKDVMELLRIIPQEDLKNFNSFALKGFKKLNSEEEQSLLQTLSVYLETNFQISETAKRLFVHRNTVVYRLEKCEELLGKSLKDAETTLQIRLALRIKTLIES
jgi:PucR family transcriptional regulator, purine catabolism regulatory protein